MQKRTAVILAVLAGVVVLGTTGVVAEASSDDKPRPVEQSIPASPPSLPVPTPTFSGDGSLDITQTEPAPDDPIPSCSVPVGREGLCVSVAR